MNNCIINITIETQNNLLLKCLISFNMTAYSLPHHCIFSHQDNCSTSKTHSDLLHLFWADIVCSDNETFWIVIQKLLKKWFEINILNFKENTSTIYYYNGTALQTSLKGNFPAAHHCPHQWVPPFLALMW